MIIYGYRNRSITLATGQFECPRCQMTRNYTHIDIIRYFTLFFIITLFPLGRVSTYVECETCRTAFKPEEIIGTKGNELFSRELQARNAAAAVKTKQKRGCATAVIGTILAAVGGFMTLLLVAFQLTGTSSPTEGLVGFFCLGAIFMLPFVLGMALLVWGVRIRQRAGEAASASAPVPMAQG
jgi:ABC-type glycerol-3-phosphate transport system permease component